MLIERGQVIVVSSKSRIRRIPASILVLRAAQDFDSEAEIRAFVYAEAGEDENGRSSKRALEFINWAIRRGLVDLVSPLPAVWDLLDIGRSISEAAGGGDDVDRP